MPGEPLSKADHEREAEYFRAKDGSELLIVTEAVALLNEVRVEELIERKSEKRKRLAKEARQKIRELINEVSKDKRKSKESSSQLNTALNTALFIEENLRSIAALHELLTMEDTSITLETSWQHFRGARVNYNPAYGLHRTYNAPAFVPNSPTINSSREYEHLSPEVLIRRWENDQLAEIKVLNASKMLLMKRIHDQLKLV